MKVLKLENLTDEIQIEFEGIQNELNSINVRGWVVDNIDLLHQLLDVKIVPDLENEWITFGEITEEDGHYYREIMITA